MLVRTGRTASRYLRISLAVWSALVDMIRLPCGLKLAVTIFTDLEGWDLSIAVLSSVTIVLGSGLRFSGIPVGRNWATSLDGWWAALGFAGVGFPCCGLVVGLGFMVVWGIWLVCFTTLE